MDEAIEKIKYNIAKSAVKPYFADEVVIMRTVKARKDGKGKVEKEGYISLVFVDMTNQKPIAKFVLSPTTAAHLNTILAREIEQLGKDVKSKTLKQPSARHEHNAYIG